MSLLAATARARARLRVRGTVQGVGFRPYVYRLAHAHGLAGWVLNDARGVLVEVEGAPEAVEAFAARLVPGAPPLAVVEAVERAQLRPTGEPGFAIRTSPVAGDGETAAPVAPDTATCEDCLRELFDPADRRHRYPFINCTNCGPRFTIVRGVPYDRPLTTMGGFEMCSVCRAEYEDPANRRFHAQPNACPACGPSLRLVPSAGPGVGIQGEAALEAACRALRDGAIVAVKGIGGYHLACRAADEAAVARLRARKHREEKPFALMARDVEQAARLVTLSDAERTLLRSPRRPIVLAARRPGAAVASAVAPGALELGVMLAYSPLHHLLLDGAGGPLVMTSGNVSDEPIAYRDADALQRLAPLAELVLLHDRPIETRTDDSVVRIARVAGREQAVLVRRSRGYVPDGLPLRGGTPRPLLACGAQLKNTVCLATGERAWVSHHIGDLENFETLEAFRVAIAHFERLFDVHPEVVAHDLHPEYLSTKHALDLEGVRPIGVQHHHAHLAATLAEHGEAGPAVGLILDGAGWGEDGTVWGGELLRGGLAGFERVGMLRPVRLPGGDAAVREPWRMACAWLAECGADPPAGLRAAVPQDRWRAVSALVRSGVASPLTSSAGRLFDAVAALCGIRTTISYEGQAAVELERACDPSEPGRYEIALVAEGDRLELDPRSMLSAIVADLGTGVAVGRIATRFHAGLAAAAVEAAARAASGGGSDLVVLSGGVFANHRLLTAIADGLAGAGLRVLVPSRLPVGDGGIAYGQAAVTAARLREELGP